MKSGATLEVMPEIPTTLDDKDKKKNKKYILKALKKQSDE